MKSPQDKALPPATESRKIEWVDVDQRVHAYDFDHYLEHVARARYVIRKVQRIIDDCAKQQGLEPLEHQALIQIHGAAERRLPIGQLAERLDIVPTFTSRLVQQLEGQGLVSRARSEIDRRGTVVSTTEEGARRLYVIVEEVHDAMAAFRASLTLEEQHSAHEIIAFYVGSTPRKEP